MLEADAVPRFIELLSSPVMDVKEQAVWALGNIAGDSARCRDYVLHCGALPPLLAIFEETTKISMLRNATWTLSNFCRGKNPQPEWPMVRKREGWMGGWMSGQLTMAIIILGGTCS